MDWPTVIRVIAHVAGGSSRAKSGYVKLGYACNNHCLFCTAEWKKGCGDRNTAAVRAEVERIAAEERPERMVYSGGEPTLRNDLPELIAYARDLEISQHVIQTNARRLRDPGYVRELKAAGLTSCYVSLHGHTASTHDALTQREGSFDQACAGMANLERFEIPFSTNTVVCRQNFRDLSDLVKLLAASFPSANKMRLSYPNLQGGAANNIGLVVAPLWEVAPWIIAAIEVGHEVGIFVDTEFVPFCFLGRYPDRGSELTLLHYHLSDMTFRIRDWDHRYHARKNIFYAACDGCELRRYCIGTHPLHHATFGEPAALAPISFATLET